jgi:hypothetical protein
MNRYLYHISKISERPFKSYDFWKTRLQYINRNFVVMHRIKLVSAFLPVSLGGKQTGGEKLAAIMSPWQPLVKL